MLSSNNLLSQPSIKINTIWEALLRKDIRFDILKIPPSTYSLNNTRHILWFRSTLNVIVNAVRNGIGNLSSNSG